MSNIIHKLSYISGISYKQAQNILEEISKAALQNATKNTKLYILSKLPYDILKNIQDEILDNFKKNLSIQNNLNLIKPIEYENLHITLVFLGEIEDKIVDILKEKLNNLEFQKIDSSYVGIGAFPSNSSSRIIWIGIDKESVQKISIIHKKIITIIKEVNSDIQLDDRFNPHITIFRIKKNMNLSEFLNKNANRDIGTDTFSSIHLKQSILTRQGPIYKDISVVDAKK